jgi:hypothetical protein
VFDAGGSYDHGNVIRMNHFNILLSFTYPLSIVYCPTGKYMKSSVLPSQCSCLFDTARVLDGETEICREYWFGENSGCFPLK